MHRETSAGRAIRRQGSGGEDLPEKGGRGRRRPVRPRTHRRVQRGPAGGAGSRIPAHGVRDPKPGRSDPAGAHRPALQYAHDRGCPFPRERHPRRADQKDTIVRLRVDGLLRETMHLPKAVHPSIVSRFKVLAKMDIAERRAPQDGAIRVKIEQREVDLRVSSLPILHGEKMVLRVTDQSKSLPKLEAIGLSEKDYATIKSFTQRHKGLILVTGPTG